MKNEYIPFLSEIKEVIRHTPIEYTFRMSYQGEVKPGQFFEVSIPKFGEAPISVSGIGTDTVDLTIRRVGKVTGEIFENYPGDSLFLRGPYGNGFDIADYEGKEVVIVAGGTGVSPVKGVIDYFSENPGRAQKVTVIAGFKSPEDMLFKKELEQWNRNLNLILTVDKDADQNRLDVPCRQGLVTEYIPELTFDNLDNAVFIVVGPPVMMKFTVEAIQKLGVLDEQIYISQERKMCCGLGKCGHCRMGDTYICLDGPVFNYTKGKLLKD